MRAFVAVEVPPDVRAAVARTQAALRDAARSADVRWVDPGALHVTLKFLGSIDDEQVARIRDALALASGAGAPLGCVTGALGAFPSPRRARVVWLGISAANEAVARLTSAVDAALTPLGFPPEARPFHAHVTLGRVRSPRGLGDLARALEAHAAGPPRSWVAPDLVLFQSHTRPTGAVYEPVARFRLGART